MKYISKDFLSYSLCLLAYLPLITHLRISCNWRPKFVNFLQFIHFQRKLKFFDNFNFLITYEEQRIKKCGYLTWVKSTWLSPNCTWVQNLQFKWSPSVFGFYFSWIRVWFSLGYDLGWDWNEPTPNPSSMCCTWIFLCSIIDNPTSTLLKVLPFLHPI